MKIVNKKAQFNYEISDRIEAGIVLNGPEVKSVRLGQVEMGTAYVKIRQNEKGRGEAYVVGMQIFPYKYADNTNYEPFRTRKLLLHQKELIALLSKMKQSRRTLVPTAIYTAHGKIKMELGLARGKKIYEKREIIKKRDLERELGG